MRYSFVCVVFSVIVVSSLYVAKSPTAAAPPDGKNFPQTFESKAEVNYYHANRSVGVDEWQDPDRPYYRLSNKRRYLYHQNVFDFQEGELHSYRNLDCTTTPLTNTSHSHILGLSVFNETEGSLISAVGVLKSYSRFNPVSVGSMAVRGIESECYVGTAMIDEAKGNITAQFCWSSNDWDEMGEVFSKPVLVELSGRVPDPEDVRLLRDIHIEVHFHSFIEGFSDLNSPFLTPENVYCHGRKFKPVPELPTFLSYHQESFADNPVVEWVTNGRVIYDKVLKLVRYENRDKTVGPPFYNEGSMSVIHDYNTGVAYYQDIILGNCTSRPIQADLFDSKNMSIRNLTGVSLVELRSPNELLNMDGNFTFVGKKMLRGIPTHYYIGLKEFSFPWLNDVMINATIGVHFLDPDVKEVAVGRGVDIEVNVPLQLVIKAYNEPNMQDDILYYQETYNFFNFDATDTSDGKPDIGETPAFAYDVRQCYNSVEEKHIRIAFSGPSYKEFLRNESALFPVFAVDSIRSAVGGRLSPLRIQSPEIDYNDTHIYLTLTLLPPPTPESQFILIKSRSYSISITEEVEVIGMKNCLDTCAYNIKFACQAFIYNSSNKSCQMTDKIVSLENTKYAEDSEMGTRTVASTGAESSLLYVSNKLSEAIQGGLLIVTLPTPNINVTKNYTAVEFVEDIYRKSSVLPIVGENLKQFTEIQGKNIMATKFFLGQMSADECARQCLNDISPKGCASFNYYYKTFKCSLSYYDPEVNTNEVFQNTETYLYSRNYLSKFTAQIGRNSYANMNDAILPVNIDVVTSVNACAKKCFEYSGQSANNGKECCCFDVCSNTTDTSGSGMKCFTNENRDTKREGLTCTRYSRNYTSDFAKRFNFQAISLDGLQTLQEISSEECASYCVKKIGSECQGYYFCPTKGQVGECGFVNSSQSQSEQPIGRLFCEYNDRTFSPNGKPYIAAQKFEPKVPEEAQTNVSVGLTVFLVIFFFVLGGFTIFIIIYFIHKAAGNSTPVGDIRMLYLNKGAEASVTQVRA